MTNNSKPPGVINNIGLRFVSSTYTGFRRIRQTLFAADATTSSTGLPQDFLIMITTLHNNDRFIDCLVD